MIVISKDLTVEHNCGIIDCSKRIINGNIVNKESEKMETESIPTKEEIAKDLGIALPNNHTTTESKAYVATTEGEINAILPSKEAIARDLGIILPATAESKPAQKATAEAELPSVEEIARQLGVKI